MNLDPMKEEYIPRGRDVIVARFGRMVSGAIGLRCVCGACLDAHPLTGYDGRADADPVYGDGLTSVDKPPSDERCDVCERPLADICREIDAAHDAQQDRWSRTSAPTVLIEYGIPAAIRCRVY